MLNCLFFPIICLFTKPFYIDTLIWNISYLSLRRLLIPTNCCTSQDVLTDQLEWILAEWLNRCGFTLNAGVRPDPGSDPSFHILCRSTCALGIGFNTRTVAQDTSMRREERHRRTRALVLRHLLPGWEDHCGQSNVRDWVRTISFLRSLASAGQEIPCSVERGQRERWTYFPWLLVCSGKRKHGRRCGSSH